MEDSVREYLKGRPRTSKQTKGFDKPVSRRTVGSYKFTVQGPLLHSDGKRLVVELRGDEHGDLVRIREEKCKRWVELDVARLYHRGLVTMAVKKP